MVTFFSAVKPFGSLGNTPVVCPEEPSALCYCVFPSGPALAVGGLRRKKSPCNEGMALQHHPACERKGFLLHFPAKTTSKTLSDVSCAGLFRFYCENLKS